MNSSGGSRVQIITVTSLEGRYFGLRRGLAGLYLEDRLEAIFESILPQTLENC